MEFHSPSLDLSLRGLTAPEVKGLSVQIQFSHNGRVGLWGVSYGGFYAAAALPRAHPALKAVSPQAPIADLFLGDDSYHNGAFMLAANFSFYTGFFPRRGGPSADDGLSRFNYGTQDGYAFYLGLGGLKEGVTPLGWTYAYMTLANGGDRVSGTLAGAPFTGSGMLVAGGGYCVGVSKAALGAAKASIGDEVEVTIARA